MVVHLEHDTGHLYNKKPYRKEGDKFEIILELHQQFLAKNDLVSREQFVDFSSTYFEGTKPELGALGYSRDGAPGKKQITFGISTGINNIPTALTIQKGNFQDKTNYILIVSILLRKKYRYYKTKDGALHGPRYHWQLITNQYGFRSSASIDCFKNGYGGRTA